MCEATRYDLIKAKLHKCVKAVHQPMSRKVAPENAVALPSLQEVSSALGGTIMKDADLRCAEGFVTCYPHVGAEGGEFPAGVDQALERGVRVPVEVELR